MDAGEVEPAVRQDSSPEVATPGPKETGESRGGLWTRLLLFALVIAVPWACMHEYDRRVELNRWERFDALVEKQRAAGFMVDINDLLLEATPLPEGARALEEAVTKGRFDLVPDWTDWSVSDDEISRIVAAGGGPVPPGMQVDLDAVIPLVNALDRLLDTGVEELGLSAHMSPTPADESSYVHWNERDSSWTWTLQDVSEWCRRSVLFSDDPTPFLDRLDRIGTVRDSPQLIVEVMSGFRWLRCRDRAYLDAALLHRLPPERQARWMEEACPASEWMSRGIRFLRLREIGSARDIQAGHDPWLHDRVDSTRRDSFLQGGDRDAPVDVGPTDYRGVLIHLMCSLGYDADLERMLVGRPAVGEFGTLEESPEVVQAAMDLGRLGTSAWAATAVSVRTSHRAARLIAGTDALRRRDGDWPADEEALRAALGPEAAALLDGGMLDWRLRYRRDADGGIRFVMDGADPMPGILEHFQWDRPPLEPDEEDEASPLVVGPWGGKWRPAR